MTGGSADVTVRADEVQATLEEQWRERVDEISRLSVQLYALRDGEAAEPDAAGNQAIEQAMIERQLAAARRAAADIEAALRRLADGTYGVCERCERPVARERLEALPHARLCAPCQAGVPRE